MANKNASHNVREGKIAALLLECLKTGGHLMEGESAKIFVTIFPPKESSVIFSGAGQRPRGYKPKRTNEKLTEIDWKKILLSYRWDRECSDALKMLKESPQAQFAMSCFERGYQTIEKINNLLRREKLPYRIYSLNPYKRGSTLVYGMMKVQL